ncbi:hypothetical protein SCHPADRAFT_825139 [Schizopora paradoxa]|uniref:Fungal-type protein kinase domain-containing protein n=1 Tax=Schizopora paradoxa TaxID=27342 RepID=A0A0H2RTK8_9AGAM|nr:hypothetical protein SCHPADRAFT_825139 [Schizopora paradoxa]
MYRSQVNRRHVVNFALTGSDLTVLMFDRSGLVASDPVDIHEKASVFLHAAIGSLYADPTLIGLDPTINTDESKGPKSILVGDNWYEILDVIYVEGALRGRGTVVYQVQKDGELYVVKDSWVDTSREDREPQILQSLADLEHIPKVVENYAVIYNGEPDTTSYFRQSEAGKSFKSEIREHRRLLRKPCARKLCDFRDLVELLTAIRDVVDGESVAFSARIFD